MKYCPTEKDYINDCGECEMCPDYPVCQMVEPYDIERDNED